MLTTVDYRSTRALQICIVFATTLVIQRWLEFSKAGWIGFAVMMIYAGFDAGTSIHRTMHRFWGTILGLILAFCLIVIGRIDYRFIIIFVPIAVFFAYFTLGKFYAFPTIFTVSLTALGADYFPSETYEPYSFFFDYFRATIIALFICVFFESIVFRKNNLTHLFYRDMQKAIVLQLQQLLDIVLKKPIKNSRYLKLSVECNLKIVELTNFVNTSKYDYHLQETQFAELHEFNEVMENTYLNVRRLFVISPLTNHNYELEAKNGIEKLNRLSQGI